MQERLPTAFQVHLTALRHHMRAANKHARVLRNRFGFSPEQQAALLASPAFKAS
jgi:hypothetical protein